MPSSHTTIGAWVNTKTRRKNLNAAKPLEQSKGLGGNICCKDKSCSPKLSHRVNSLQYNFGEKPNVILYTDINHYVGTPKQKEHYLNHVPGMNLEFSTVCLHGLRILDYYDEIVKSLDVKYIWTTSKKFIVTM